VVYVELSIRDVDLDMWPGVRQLPHASRRVLRRCLRETGIAGFVLFKLGTWPFL
jgi:hypothetical protein